MVSINLKKAIAKKHIKTSIREAIAACPTPIRISDARGNILAGGHYHQGKKIPIVVAGETVGWVEGDENAIAIAPLLACILQQEVEKKSLANELLERYQEIDLFQDLSTQITASLELEEIASLAIAELKNLIPSSSGAIFLLEKTSGMLEVLSAFGEVYAPRDCLILARGLVGKITQKGCGEIVNNVAADSRGSHRDRLFSALICVPLKAEERTIGTIVMGSQTPANYSTEELKILDIFAGQIAIALERALLYRKSQTIARHAQERAEQLQRALEELKCTQAKLVQSEKMSSLGHTIAGVAHEINNPMNFINGNLSHALEYAENLLELLRLYEQYCPQIHPDILEKVEEMDLEFMKVDLPELLASMQKGVDRIQKIVLSLRIFSRLDGDGVKPANLHEGIDSTLMILHHRLKARGNMPEIKIIKDYGNLPSVVCHAGQLNQVFMNIINNAIDALEVGHQSIPPSDRHPSYQGGQGGSLNNQQLTPEIRIRTQVIEENWVSIYISDNGCGIPANTLQRIYEPFFTTKPVGKGTGLGMAISYQIVTETHGGSLECYSQLDMGTQFCINLPMTPVHRRHEETANISCNSTFKRVSSNLGNQLFSGSSFL
ncbi:MAG: GAF domain-containing protein [Cyanobacteria bacterium SBLK]|nr:GAF domain-containing protein [Cyanobacteria bacterium SBLK]